MKALHVVCAAAIALVHDDVVRALDLLDKQVHHLALRIDVLLLVLRTQVRPLRDVLLRRIKREEVRRIHYRDHGLQLTQLHHHVSCIGGLHKLPTDVLGLGDLRPSPVQRHFARTRMGAPLSICGIDPGHLDNDVVVLETAPF